MCWLIVPVTCRFSADMTSGIKRRMSFDHEERIFNILLVDDQRKSCAAFIVPSKEHYHSLAPKLWHTVHLGGSTIDLLGSVLTRPRTSSYDPQQYTKCVIVTKGPLTWESLDWCFDPDDIGLETNRNFAKRLTSLVTSKRVILCQSFTIHMGLTLFQEDFRDSPMQTEPNPFDRGGD